MRIFTRLLPSKLGGRASVLASLACATTLVLGACEPKPEPSPGDSDTETDSGDAPSKDSGEGSKKDPSEDGGDTSESGEGDSDSDGEKSESGDGEKSESGEGDSESGGEGSEEDKSGEGSEEDKSGEKRDCDTLEWNEEILVEEGQVIMRDDQKGYIDSDFDGKLETDELVDVGTCQLHLTGKKCGVIAWGKKNWATCGPRFREISKIESELKEKEIPFYGIYTDYETIDKAMDASIKKYTKGFANMFSDKTEMVFDAGPPTIAVLDLRTMTVVAMSSTMTGPEVLEACDGLKD